MSVIFSQPQGIEGNEGERERGGEGRKGEGKVRKRGEEEEKVASWLLAGAGGGGRP